LMIPGVVTTMRCNQRYLAMLHSAHPSDSLHLRGQPASNWPGKRRSGGTAVPALGCVLRTQDALLRVI